MTVAGNSLRSRSLSHLDPLLDHSQVLQIGGGLLAGAATISAGYHAWDEDKEGRTEEEVSLLPHSHSDFSLLTLVVEERSRRMATPGRR